MNANASIRRASLIALLALLALPVTTRVATALGPPNETAVAAVVREGDNVIVRTHGAALMVGQDVLARLASGQKLPVTAVQGTWLGTSVQAGSRNLQGWIQSTDVMLARTNGKHEPQVAEQPSTGAPTTSGPQRVTAFRPIVSEPQWQPMDHSRTMGRQRSYGPGEWDYYWSGHHEPDPNLHTWEPWRYSELIQSRSVFR